MSFDGVFTHYMVEELKNNLQNGRINKIYQVSDYELVFNIRAKAQNQRCLFSIHPIYSRVQLTAMPFTYPQEPPMFCMLLRKHLEGGIIRQIKQKGNDRIILIDIEHLNEIGDTDQKQLIIEVMGKHSNIVLINKHTNKIIDCIKHISPFQNSYRTVQPGADYIYPPSNDKVPFLNATLADFENLDTENLNRSLVHYFEGVSPVLANELLHLANTHTPLGLYNAKEDLSNQFNNSITPSIVESNHKSYYYLVPLKSVEGDVKSFPTLGDLLDRFYFKKDEQERIKQQTQDLERYIKNELDKNKNKLNNLMYDLTQSELMDKYKLYGELIMSNAYQITKGIQSVEVENYYTPGTNVTIPLNPLMTPIENSQRYYHRYQKAKKSVHHIEHQIKLTNDEIQYFETLTQQIQSANLEDALEIRQELETLGYLRKRNKHRYKKPTKLKYETYQIEDAVIYVGKNNLQNDYLTFSLAHKDDLWMHVKDIPGSHVIIRANELTESVLRTGAMLASYYSQAKDSSSVPVDYTHIRNVKKIPGMKPGFVSYDKQKTIYIDPDEDFIHSLTSSK